MPHIPDEELHAYLDQALGRLRCVEIESHVAECTRCRMARDEIAALRDQTTALLARLAPRRTPLPPLAEIRRRAAARVFLRERRLQRVAWAASVVMALGVGWGASALVHPPASVRPPASGSVTAEPAAPATAVATPAAAPAPGTAAGPAAETPVAQAAGAPTPAPAEAAGAAPVARKRPTVRRRAPPVEQVADQAPPAEVANVGGIAKDGQLEFGGVWRNLSWDGATEQAGDTPPRIDGLPVTEVQVQAGDGGHKPLMVVAQQLASGEVIRTIEGPVSDVSALLGTHARPMVDSPAAGAPRGPAPSALGSAFSFRHGDRMFAVTGSLPSDSLRAMMRRLNLMSRVR